MSRTHRVAFDWLFDWINLEPKIQIKYVDMPTKESFSRDEWNHLLRLFNIKNFSMFSYSHLSEFLCEPMGKQSAMSKGGQQAGGFKRRLASGKTEAYGTGESETNQLGITQAVEREKTLHKIW